MNRSFDMVYNSSLPSHLGTRIGAFFAFFFVLFGFFGNLLIIIVIVHKKELRNNLVNIFIVSLQLNDIFNICFNQFLVGLSYVYIEWYTNEILCELFVYSSIICTGSLLWHHALIGIHRYLVVVKNQTNSFMKMSPKTYGFLSLVLARLIPVLVALPAIIYRNKTVYVNKTLRCMLGNNSGTENKIIFLFNIILPCLIELICFIRIFSRVHQVSRKMQEKKARNNSDIPLNSYQTEYEKLNQMKNSKHFNSYKRELKISKMFGIIFTVFLFGYLPYGLIRSIDKNNSLNADVYILLTIMFIISISISPIIYGLMNTQIKIQCLLILKFIFCCRKTRNQQQNLRNKRFITQNDYERRNSLACMNISETQINTKLTNKTNTTRYSEYNKSETAENKECLKKCSSEPYLIYFNSNYETVQFKHYYSLKKTPNLKRHKYESTFQVEKKIRKLFNNSKKKLLVDSISNQESKFEKINNDYNAYNNSNIDDGELFKGP